MGNTFTKIEEIITHSKDLIATQIELYKLEIAEKSALVISSLILLLIGIIFFLLFLIFIRISFAYLISNYLQSNVLGFFIVGIFFLLINIFIFIKRNTFIRMPIINYILKVIFK